MKECNIMICFFRKFIISFGISIFDFLLCFRMRLRLDVGMCYVVVCLEIKYINLVMVMS